MANFGEFQAIIDNLGKFSGPTNISPDIAQAGASKFQVGPVAAAGGGISYNDKANIANEDAAKRRRLDEIQQRIKDMEDEQDPSKYYLQLREDGGFNFYNPKGEQISLAKYSLATNKTADEILKKSGSNRDQEYVQRQEILNKIAEARYYGEKDKEEELIKKYSGNDKDIEKAVKTTTVDEMMRSLARAYGDVLGDNFQQQGGTGLGSSSPTNIDIRSNFQRVKDLFNPLQ